MLGYNYYHTLQNEPPQVHTLAETQALKDGTDARKGMDSIIT